MHCTYFKTAFLLNKNDDIFFILYPTYLIYDNSTLMRITRVRQIITAEINRFQGDRIIGLNTDGSHRMRCTTN